jgi:hypothetical protein
MVAKIGTEKYCSVITWLVDGKLKRTNFCVILGT